MGDELRSIVRNGATVPFYMYSTSLSLLPYDIGAELQRTTLHLGLFVGGAIKAESL